MFWIAGTLVWAALAAVVVVVGLRRMRRLRCPGCGLSVDRSLDRCPYCHHALTRA